MKQIYKNNMRYLIKLSSKFKNILEKIESNNVKIIKCANGSKSIIKKDLLNEVAIHSLYNPEKVAQYVAEYATSDEKSIVFLFGMGMGYELKAMLNKNSDIRYFVIEPDLEIFKVVLAEMDIRELFDNSNISFILDSDYKNIINFLSEQITKNSCVNLKFIVNPSYNVLYEDLVKDLNEHITKMINMIRVNIHTVYLRSNQWFINYAMNLQYLKFTCPIKKMKGQFKDVPAIVVGAGPSINYNIDYLKKVKGSAFIVAVGTGIRVLEKNNIKADMIAALDGSELEEDIFKGISLNKDSNLMYSSMLFNTIPSMVGKTKFLFNTASADDYIHDGLKWDKFKLYSGNSVTNTVIDNLGELGFNTIIVLGQDLCYSQNKRYASGVEDIKGDNRADNVKNERLIEMTNVKGESVYTNPPFVSVKDALELCAVYYNNIKFYNGSSNGLDIKGFENIDFNEYVDNKLVNGIKHDFEVNIEKIYFEHLQDNEDEVDKFILSMKEDNKSIVNKCKKIISSIENNSVDKNWAKNKIVEFENILLYSKVIQPVFSLYDTIYKSQDSLEGYKKLYSEILYKCLLMESCFEILEKNKES